MAPLLQQDLLAYSLTASANQTKTEKTPNSNPNQQRRCLMPNHMPIVLVRVREREVERDA